MPTDYEQVYRQKRRALGEPTKEFVEFFDDYSKQHADILDLGCGQGRDALFIARRGHHVVGVDISKTGIAQLLEDAQAEGLNIEAEVADLVEYQPVGEYDVVIIDRTLHMLDAKIRPKVLAHVSHHVRDNGFILIDDEPTNLPGMRAFFEQDDAQWTTIKDRRGFLFVQKQ